MEWLIRKSSGVPNGGAKTEAEGGGGSLVNSLLDYFVAPDENEFPLVGVLENVTIPPFVVGGLQLSASQLQGLSNFTVKTLTCTQNDRNIQMSVEVIFPRLHCESTYTYRTFWRTYNGEFQAQMKVGQLHLQTPLVENRRGYLQVERANCVLKYEKLEVEFDKNRVLAATLQGLVNSYLFKLVKPRLIHSFLHNYIPHLNKEIISNKLKLPNLIMLLDGVMRWINHKLIPVTLTLPKTAVPGSTIPGSTATKSQYVLKDGTLIGLSLARHGDVKCYLQKNMLHFKLTVITADPISGEYTHSDGQVTFSARCLRMRVFIEQSLNVTRPPSMTIEDSQWEEFKSSLEGDLATLLHPHIQSSVVAAINTAVIHKILALMKHIDLRKLIAQNVKL